MIKPARLSAAISAFLFVAILSLGWFAYAPALSGAFMLDDVSNLAELETVNDNLSALRFAFSGTAGPLGRPLALASFLPQADAWSDGVRPFLTVNILIHLLNAAILAAILLRLSILRGVNQQHAIFVALTASALWLYMPLLASSSLMIVQRMTTLSATFVLLGLFAYLHARQGIDSNSRKSLIGMSLSLVVATVLAVLTKENGALLPVYILALESTILNKPERVDSRHWRNWSLIFLWLPTTLILVYLATRVPYSPATVLRRDFTSWERLLTESRILWDYLARAFIPLPGRISPYLENYPISRSIFEPSTLASVLAWAAVAAAAVVWHRRYPLVALASLWYVGGHVIESTVLPLELYFEHRNYLPIIGPIFAVTLLAVQVPARFRKLGVAILPLCALIFLVRLFGLTSMWGDPSSAARYWYDRSPDSVRAATIWAGYQMSETGIESGLITLRDFVGRHPEHGYLLIQDLRIACLIAPEKDYRDRVVLLNGVLGSVNYTLTAGTMLSELSTTARQLGCNGVDSESVRSIAESLRQNRRYANDKTYNHFHHKLMASIYRHEENTLMTLEHLENANEIFSSEEIDMMIVTTLASDGYYDAARSAIAEALEHRPIHPVKRYLQARDMTELGHYVDALEKRADQNNSPQSDTGTPTT